MEKGGLSKKYKSERNPRDFTSIKICFSKSFSDSFPNLKFKNKQTKTKN